MGRGTGAWGAVALAAVVLSLGSGVAPNAARADSASCGTDCPWHGVVIVRQDGTLHDLGDIASETVHYVNHYVLTTDGAAALTAGYSDDVTYVNDGSYGCHELRRYTTGSGGAQVAPGGTTIGVQNDQVNGKTLFTFIAGSAVPEIPLTATHEFVLDPDPSVPLDLQPCPGPLDMSETTGSYAALATGAGYIEAAPDTETIDETLDDPVAEGTTNVSGISVNGGTALVGSGVVSTIELHLSRLYDTDGDGCSDDTELTQMHTDIFNPDSDGDGWNDCIEANAGSDPTDPTSHPVPVPVQAAPVVVVPATITTPASTPDGVPVSFDVTATDANGSVPVTCDPPSGSTFPVGTTEVTCSATNPIGTTTASFEVIVQPPVCDHHYTPVTEYADDPLFGERTLELDVGVHWCANGASAWLPHGLQPDVFTTQIVQPTFDLSALEAATGITVDSVDLGPSDMSATSLLDGSLQVEVTPHFQFEIDVIQLALSAIPDLKGIKALFSPSVLKHLPLSARKALEGEGVALIDKLLENQAREFELFAQHLPKLLRSFADPIYSAVTGALSNVRQDLLEDAIPMTLTIGVDTGRIPLVIDLSPSGTASAIALTSFTDLWSVETPVIGDGA